MITIKQSMKLLAISSAFAAQSALGASLLYDFNHLSSGALVGQDSWQQMETQASVQIGGGSQDGTQYVNSSNGWAAAQRSGSFALPDYSNAVTGVFGADMFSQDWGSYMGLATDNNFSAGTLYLNFDDQRDQFRLRGTSFTDITISNFSSIVDTTWLRARVEIDFTAYGGAGSASVFVQDLLDTNASVIAVAGLQNINIGLTPGTGGNHDPASWQYAFVGEADGINGIDNLYFEANDATPTPIAAPLSLMTLGLVTLGLRRARQSH